MKGEGLVVSTGEKLVESINLTQHSGANLPWEKLTDPPHRPPGKPVSKLPPHASIVSVCAIRSGSHDMLANRNGDRQMIVRNYTDGGLHAT